MLKAAVLYFALVFGAGFVLGPIRILWTVPRFGTRMAELMDTPTIDRLSDRTRNGGAEIVNLLKAGSAYYAPGVSAAVMVEAILKDQRRIMPCAAYLTGQYGLEGLFVGVPAKLGANGVEQIIELKLTDEEAKALRQSADIVKKSMTEAKLI
jgi:malate dehydrogenase